MTTAAFEKLKADVGELIQTATETINHLVDQAAKNAQAAVDSAVAPVIVDLTPHLTDLSTNVRAAIDSLKAQAALILGETATSAPVAPASPASPVPAAPVQGNLNIAEPVAPASTINNDPNAAPPASASLPNAFTIGPESFKSGA